MKLDLSVHVHMAKQEHGCVSVLHTEFQYRHVKPVLSFHVSVTFASICHLP